MKNKKRIDVLTFSMIFFSSMMIAQEKIDSVYTYSRPDGGVTEEKEIVAAEDKISGESLKRYPDIVLSNSLQGKAAGLIVRMTNNGLGNNLANIFIRGLSTNEDSQAIIIIDGIERPLDDLLAEEIESIEILKDAPAKILYGPAAANGVVVIKTKRGYIGRRAIKLSADIGVMESTRVPQFLDSYRYATLYNEARVNDGLPELYLPSQLEGYKNSSGPNDVIYPNCDWYNYFLKKQSLYRKATLETSGGNSGFKYSMVAGYLGGGGFEKVGDGVSLNRLNFRGNLDISVTDFLNVSADVAGRMENRDWAAINTADVFNALSNNHPNEYPLMISSENLGLSPNEDGTPYFGASIRKPSNLLADLEYRGFSQESYVTSQTNVGLDFTFDKYIKGLTASGYFTFDNYQYIKRALTEDFDTYGVRSYLNEAGMEQVQYTLLTKRNPNDDIDVTDNETRRTTGWRANVGYKNNFGVHEFSSIVGYRYFKDEKKGTTQDAINCNYNLRMNYGYAKKYLFEWNSSYMGANKFAPGNRYFLSWAGAGGWIISNEDFLNKSKKINFLKLKVSYGVLGFAKNTDYLLYKTAWNDGGTILLNEGNTSNDKVVNLVRVGNPNLKWEKSNEFNSGVEGAFFNNNLNFELNYFNEKRENIIGTLSSSYGAYIGSYIMQTNLGSVQNHGFDGFIAWNSKKSNLDYRIGLNFTVSKNKLLTWDENKNIENYRKTIGKQTDAIFGLQSLGLFGRDVELEGAPVQSFGPYGIGDIAYVDQNKDNVIDGRDQIQIGHSFPTSTFGIDITLNYKNWGFYILGTSEVGVNKMLSNAYYWNKGDGKYSILAEQRYHPLNNPNGTYPILTSKEGLNSFRNSDFWIADASFFRLKNLELSYSFKVPTSQTQKIIVKVYARGNNLLVFSKIKDLDPEVIDAGVTNNPVSAFYTSGISFTF